MVLYEQSTHVNLRCFTRLALPVPRLALRFRAEPSCGAAAASVMPSASFPPAAQPDLVRAAQKDAFYLAMLREQVSELARALLGARRAVGLQREAGLLASLLYFGLTTGCGLPTLGEEYCDLALVEGPAQRPLGRGRRAALVAAHTLLPYALAREVRAAAAAVAADDGEASAVTTREDASFASPSAALRSLVQRLRAALRVVLSNAGVRALLWTLHLHRFHPSQLTSFWVSPGAPRARLPRAHRPLLSRRAVPVARVPFGGRAPRVRRRPERSARLLRRARRAAAPPVRGGRRGDGAPRGGGGGGGGAAGA